MLSRDASPSTISILCQEVSNQVTTSSWYTWTSSTTIALTVRIGMRSLMLSSMCVGARGRRTCPFFRFLILWRVITQRKKTLPLARMWHLQKNSEFMPTSIPRERLSISYKHRRHRVATSISLKTSMSLVMRYNVRSRIQCTNAKTKWRTSPTSISKRLSAVVVSAKSSSSSTS